MVILLDLTNASCEIPTVALLKELFLTVREPLRKYQSHGVRLRGNSPVKWSALTTLKPYELVGSGTDLERAESSFPQEAYEALFLLASGYTIDQVFAEVEKAQEAIPEVDTANFGQALTNEDSQRRFHIVEDAQELAEILTAPLEQWRIFLHPKQRQLVQVHANGPMRVLGGAGTGKTVVAMHRARYLAEGG